VTPELVLFIVLKF